MNTKDWKEKFRMKFGRLVDVTGFYDEYTREEFKLSKRDYEILSFIEEILEEKEK